MNVEENDSAEEECDKNKEQMFLRAYSSKRIIVTTKSARHLSIEFLYQKNFLGIDVIHFGKIERYPITIENR